MKVERFCQIARWLVACMALASSFGVGTVAAQDDWSLTRERPRPSPGGATVRRRPKPAAVGHADDPSARNKQLLARYERVFERQPQDTFAIDRIFELVSVLPGGVRKYVQEKLSTDSGYPARLLAGHLLARLGDGVAAKERYREATAIAENRPEAHAALGRLLVEQGQLNEGAKELESALALSKGHQRGVLLQYLVELHLQNRNLDGARARFEQLRKLGGGGVQPVLDFALALERAGFRQEAIQNLRNLAAGVGRGKSSVFRVLGEMELQGGQLQHARENLWSAHRTARDSGMRAEIEELLFEAYRQSGELGALSRALEKTPHSIKTSIRISEELGASKQAIELYRKALHSSPHDEQLRIGLVRALQRSGDAEGAVREQTALLRHSRQPAEHVVRFAELVSATKSRAEALKVLREVAKSRRTDADFYRALAELYARWNLGTDYGEALTQLAKIDGGDPSNLEALGRYRYEAGDRDGALDVWRGVLRNRPGLSGRVRYAQILMSNGLFREAAEEYRDLLKGNPKSLEVVRGLGEACDAARDYACAADAWQKAIALAPDGGATQRQARAMLITSWLRGQSASRERKRLKKVVEAEPSNLEAARQLLELLRRQGQRYLPEAEELAMELTKRLPSDLSLWQDLERIRLAQGDRKGAIDALEAQARLEPQRATSALARMVDHAEAIYEDEQALRYAERAVKLSPRNAESHQLLGRLLQKRGKTKEAIAHYEKALELDPRQLPVYGVLSELYRAEKNLGAAATVCRQFLKQAPEDDLVEAAFRSCVDMSLDADSVGPLEGVLLALTYEHPERAIFRRALLELYARPERTEALSERALRPALDALLDSSPVQRSLGIALLRKLKQSQAVPPLLALAARGDDEPLLRYEALSAAVEIAAPEQAPIFVEFSHTAEGELQLPAAWAAFAKMRQPLFLAETSNEQLLAALEVVASGTKPDAVHVQSLRRWLAGHRLSVTRTAIAMALGASDGEWSGEKMPTVSPDPVGWIRLGLAKTTEGRLALANNWSLGDRDALVALLFSFLDDPSFDLPAPRFGEREAAYMRRVAERMLGEVALGKSDQTSWARLVSFLADWASHAENATALRGGRDLKIMCGRLAPSLMPSPGCGALQPGLDKALERFESTLAKRAIEVRGEVPRVTEILVAAASPESGRLAERALSSDDEQQRWAILLVLAERPEVGARLVPQLSRIAKTGRRWEERWAAVQALSLTARTRALLQAIAKKDPNAMVRSAAQAKLASLYGSSGSR